MIKGLLQKFRKPKARTQAQRMLTLRSVPVYYLPITKSGSTFLKNLFYYLDHAEEHAAGIDIHSNPDDLVRANSGDEETIRQSPYAFAVLRNPADRFLSLYFDKIYGDGPNNFADIRSHLANEIGLDLTSGIDANVHHENCNRFIDWLALNLSFKTEVPVNPHWRRQSSRLQRVGGLDLTHLTLDGLGWQLPQLLGDIVPNIRQAMKAVKSDNRTEKPYTRADIVDAALLAKINAVYSSDRKLYEQALRTWQPWNEYHPEVTKGETIRCFTAVGHPINCIAISKIGRTYLRNLLYLLEHDKEYHDPLKIHTEGASSHSELTKNNVAKEVSFFVIRDPVERFFSLYFDKIHGTGEQSFPWIAKRLVAHRGFVHEPNITVAQHRANCLALLGYIGRKFDMEAPQNINSHWSPQVEMAKKAVRFGLKPLVLENLDEQLLIIAGGRIEGLESTMQALPQRNSSSKPYTIEEILTPEISQIISDLYGDDQALYERVKTAWETTGHPPKL
ncbi:MAG: sulfotransferase family 2 domain-containing protein [Rhodobacteraceae bacterium]|nr:sulfotransferase family 2 domain-containing protein [Paracoccaceae bacterium]